MKQFKSEDKGLNKKNNKESGNRRKWICGILAVLLLLVLIWLLHSCRAEPVHEFFDPSARPGTLPGRSEKEIQEELNRAGTVYRACKTESHAVCRNVFRYGPVYGL